ncbi:efflux RND transporter periplasmic adaptor subunit [Pararhizobium mangrovi]|nr:efflux RND transporter periplasmic adaptor subunit [Pararhizobium mangrovi]
MKRGLKKLLQTLVVAGLVVVVSGAGWMMFGESEPQAAPATASVEPGTIEETVLASGSLEASSVVSIGAEVSGRIETIAPKLGDHVEKGDLVATIDSQSQQYALKTAEAQLANVKAERAQQDVALKQAKIALTRSSQLRKKNLVSELDYETAEANVDSADAKLQGVDAQIEQAELAVDTARVDLDRTRIRAPSSGTVVAVLVSPGQTVNANQTTPTLLKIADLATMEINAQISEADVTKVKPGQKAYFSILGEPDRKIDAELLSLEPAPTDIKTSDTGLASDDQAVYYNAIFRVNNPNGLLRIAMTAQVTIVIDRKSGVLTVPSGAVVHRGGASYVLAYDPQTKDVTRTPVTVGLDNDVTAEITDGLEKGETVLATGSRSAAGSGMEDRQAKRMMRHMGGPGFGA